MRDRPNRDALPRYYREGVAIGTWPKSNPRDAMRAAARNICFARRLLRVGLMGRNTYHGAEYYRLATWLTAAEHEWRQHGRAAPLPRREDSAQRHIKRMKDQQARKRFDRT